MQLQLCELCQHRTEIN